MPLVHRQDGFQFHIWFNDHRPPHVHVANSDGAVVITLDDFRVAAKKKGKMKPGDVARAVTIVIERQGHLREEWRKIHG